MQQPFAVCENSHFFRAGFGFDPGDSGITVTLTVQSAPRICPECGANARVLGGSYHIAKDTIELLQGPERTVSELERLREILREAREGGSNPEEVKAAVQREFPEWGRVLARLLVPKTPGEFYGLLSLIVATIGVLLAYERSEQTKDVKPDQIINNIVVQQAAPVPGQPQVTPPAAGPTRSAHGERIGRNEPCPCGSGQKFKRCHGKDGQKRYQGP